MKADISIPEVFREHFDECFRHFVKRFYTKMPRGSKGISKALNPMMVFCGVHENTANRWLQERGEIIGAARIKMSCFLELHGYKIIEVERLSPVLRGIWDIIGYDICPQETVFQALGYVQISELTRIFAGKAQMSEERQQKVWDFWKQHRDSLARKKEDAFRNGRIQILSHPPEKNNALILELVSGPPNKSREAALSIMKGLLGMFEDGLFDDMTSDELAEITKSAKGTVLRLTSYLNTLSSGIMTAEQE